MKVTVLGLDDDGPDRRTFDAVRGASEFRTPGVHTSPDGAWSLVTSGCREPGMAQPLQCNGILRAEDTDAGEWPVGRITRAAVFQPWIGRRPLAAWSMKGRIVIGDPTNRTTTRCDAIKHVGTRVLLGHRDLDRLLVAGHRAVALLDNEAKVITWSRSGRQQAPSVGGFSIDGKLYVQLFQPEPHQTATLVGFDSTSGQQAASIDVGTIHKLIDEAIRTRAPAKNYTDHGHRTLSGGWWMGRIGVIAHPNDQTLTLHIRIPTGDTCDVRGTTAAVVDNHRIHVAVEA
jgi:hypothetical protein